MDSCVPFVLTFKSSARFFRLFHILVCHMQAMGRRTKDADTLAVHIPDAWISIIQSRADDAGITKSKFAAAIIGLWIEGGCPPVTPADAALQTLKGNIQQSTSARKKGAA